MKHLLKLDTFQNTAGEKTVSSFVTMFVDAMPDKPPIITVQFQEQRVSDGEWKRDFVMYAKATTVMKAYHIVDGARVQLMRVVNGLPSQVTTDEFTLHRFLCWDNAFVSLKTIVQNGIMRRKANEEALRGGQEAEPTDEFTLPPGIPPEMFIAYLDDLNAE